jgi:pyruvate dehydrogenase (quinone)
MFKDVAGAFVALGKRRITAIVLPNDLQETPYQDHPRKHGNVRRGIQ